MRRSRSERREIPRKSPDVVARPNAPVAPQRPAAPSALDAFDRRILAALVANARASNVEIARRAGLSEAPCSRRIRRLESAGIIRGYGAQLAPEALGIGFIAFVTLVLDYVTGATAAEFAEKIRAIPEVLSCYIVSGSYDAILHVATRDSRTYSEIVFEQLRRIPGVKDVRSSFVMRAVKESSGLPVGAEE